MRLRKGAGYEGDWVTTAGLVRDFDALDSAGLAEAGPIARRGPRRDRHDVAGRDVAAAEAGRSGASNRAGTAEVARHGPPRDGQVLMMALPHAEAALKLDPTLPRGGPGVCRRLGLPER